MGVEGRARAGYGARVLTLVVVGLLVWLSGFWAGSRFSGSSSQPAASSHSLSDMLASATVGAMLAGSGPRQKKPATATTPYYEKGTTRFGQAFKAEAVCLNTCRRASNGVCDEGRFGVKDKPSDDELMVFCDLGTDCDDCGPWTPSGHAPWITDNTPGPIERLLKEEIEVRSKRAAYDLCFQFAYTDPAKHVDVSKSMSTKGINKAGVTSVLHQILRDKCDATKNSGKRGLLLDVGANLGWFSLLAAKHGCRVIGFEPVSSFHAFYEYNVHLNGFAQLVDMRSNVASHVTDTTLRMVVPNRGIWGTAGIDGLNIDKAVQGNVNKESNVPAQRLDDLVHEDVLVMKVDVEGWEWSVMQGAAELLTKHNVENIIMEYSPGVPERNHRYKEYKATVSMLVNTIDSGYRIGNLGEGTELYRQNGTLDTPLTPFQEITSHNLMYDLVDAELFGRRWIGCPTPERLTKHKAWAGCLALPEDLSPRSLRSTIEYNTMIWAVKESRWTRPLLRLKGTVGIVHLDAPHNQYYVTPPTGQSVVKGMGARVCASIPPEYQVRHRCACTAPDKCGEEAKDVETAVQQKELVSNYILTAQGKLVSGTGRVSELMAEIRSARVIQEPYKPGRITVSLV